MRFIAALAWLLAVSLATGQDLASFRSIGTVDGRLAASRYKQIFKEEAAPGREIKLFKAVYNSRHAQLSGLVAIPADGAPKGLVIYFHGATADRNNVPSRYNGEAEAAVLAFATAGYAVAAPDYAGLGDDPGFHPFPMGSLNSQSGIDLIAPARALAGQVGLGIGSDLFVTGYSEGGAAAMWAVRQMQALSDPLYRVVRSAPLSGPYDLTGAQAKAMLHRQSNLAWLAARVYFASYAARAVQKNVTPIRLEDYFAPSFASYIPFVYDQELGDDKLIKKLLLKAMQLGAFQTLGHILTSRFRKALEHTDITDPVVDILRQNDCLDWTPTTPMYLVCIEDDFVVVKENTLNFIASMRKRGIGPDLAAYYVIGGRKYDHMKGLMPTLLLARKFLDGGFPAVPTANR